MIDLFIQMLSYPFLIRAIVVGALVSLCASLLGVSLVLKRYSMIGDGLSHVGFGALAIATAIHAAPLAVAIPVVMVAAFFLLRLSENSKIKGDAAIALISTGALAIGVMAISLSTGMNVDVYNYMFGSILAMSQDDVWLSIVLAAIVLGLYVVFYHKIFAITFDENFAAATGTPTGVYDMIIAVVTAVVIVLAMNLVGSLLTSALIVFPTLSAMRVFKSYKRVVVCSAALSVGCAVFGILFSILVSTPVGATIVATDILAFMIFSGIGTFRRK